MILNLENQKLQANFDNYCDYRRDLRKAIDYASSLFDAAILIGSGLVFSISIAARLIIRAPMRYPLIDIAAIVFAAIGAVGIIGTAYYLNWENCRLIDQVDDVYVKFPDDFTVQLGRLQSQWFIKYLDGISMISLILSVIFLSVFVLVQR